MRKKRVQILISSKTEKEIQERAKEEEISVSEFIRRLISVALKEKLYERF